MRTRMSYSVKTKMLTAFLLSSLIILVLVFTVTHYIFRREFSSYITETHQRQDQEIINYLTSELNQEGKIDENSLWAIAHRGMMEGYEITLYDKNKRKVWELGQGMMEMMNPRAGKGEYHEQQYPLQIKGETEAYVGIGRYSLSYLSEEDMRFQSSLYRGLLVTAVFSIFMTVFISFLFARGLSAPIIAVKDAATQLKKGNFGVRTHIHTTTREVQELASSINQLGASLEKQEMLRRRLTSDISHELRTPLNILQSHIEAILDGIWQPTPERLQSCHSEILRLTSLVKDLEKLTQLETEGVQINRESVSINQLIKEVIFTFEPQYHQKDIGLDFHQEAEVTALVDKLRMSQVLMNLLSNALKYTPSGGQVEIILAREEKEFIVQVKDSGMGIQPYDVPHIFERFYRGDISRNRDTGGAGIGLAVVQSIVKAHKGKIDVYSQPGEGASFIIRIPILLDKQSD